MHQSTTPSLSQTIWPKWASRQLFTLPIAPTLLPVTFGCSLSSEAVVMRQLRRWKRLWRRSLTRSHKRTSRGLLEVFGMVQEVRCSRRRLLRRGLEFHVCTINKSAHTKKVWKLIVCTSYLTHNLGLRGSDLSESGPNSANGIRTRLLQCHRSKLKPQGAPPSVK